MKQISTHISIEWLDEHQILFVKITNTPRTDLDIYVTWIGELMATWDYQSPFFICYDLTFAALTPYSRHIATRVGEIMPYELKGRTAIILIRGFLGNMLSHFFNRYIPITTEIMQRQFFQDAESALAWLREGLPK